MHQTIAELMIFANEQVAREIVGRFPQAAIVRHHARPPPHKLASAVELAGKAGVALDTSSNAALATSMAQAKAVLDPALFAVVNDGTSDVVSRALFAVQVHRNFAFRRVVPFSPSRSMCLPRQRYTKLFLFVLIVAVCCAFRSSFCNDCLAFLPAITDPNNTVTLHAALVIL